MNATSTEFLEIEHKFIVDSAFDLQSFVASIRKLKPRVEKQVEVNDTYFLPSQSSNFIYRHRIDKEIQQLTIKSRGKDNEIRSEINLNLGAVPSQQAAVEAWMNLIGISDGYAIQKSIWVFEFEDCEVVHYKASYAGRSVFCVEFEAVRAKSEEAALETLAKYEGQAGFESKKRTDINLFDLLVLTTS